MLFSVIIASKHMENQNKRAKNMKVGRYLDVL